MLLTLRIAPLLGFLAAACSERSPFGPSDGGSDGEAFDANGPDEGSFDSGAAGDSGGDASLADAGMGTDAGDTPDGAPLFPFKPSNLAIPQLRLTDTSDLGDVVIDSDKCAVETEPGGRKVLKCQVGHLIGPVPGHRVMVVRINEDPPLDVVVARSWTITESGKLAATSRMVLVALEDINVSGWIIGDQRGGAWGYDTDPAVRGPGVGAMGDYSHGSGGAAFCGTGGSGSPPKGGPAASYGNPELIPPRVGSAGGSSTWGSGGSGGGFVHLVAGRSISIPGTGGIACGGGKGWSGGGGGGSGGAILLEALTVSIGGVVAANGGAGGGGIRGTSGTDATRNAIQAAGGLDSMNRAVGGKGAAGAVINGEDAMTTIETAGGGGAAGRIRINTSTGMASVAGLLTPELATACATVGTIHPPE